MTANPFAALLRDVPRYASPDGNMLAEEHVLAALAAAVPADLAEAGKVDFDAMAYGFWSIHPRDVPDPVGMPEKYKGGARAWHYANTMRQAFAAFLARIAGQEAQIKGLEAEAAATDDLMAADSCRIAALETALAAEKAKTAKLVEALNTIDALDPEVRIGDCSVNAISGLVLRMGEIARAAITEASQ